MERDWDEITRTVRQLGERLRYAEDTIGLAIGWTWWLLDRNCHWPAKWGIRAGLNRARQRREFPGEWGRCGYREPLKKPWLIGSPEQLADKRPGPAARASVRDLVARLLRNCDATTVRIVRLKIRGYTHKAIARKIGVGYMTVVRRIRALKRKARRELPDECEQLAADGTD
jgi:hypothetical protein